MSVGGTIIDIVKVAPNRWWVDTIEKNTIFPESIAKKTSVAVYVDPGGNELEVGDHLWWQGQFCYWTPQKRENGKRTDIRIKKCSYSGVTHPDLIKKPTEKAT